MVGKGSFAKVYLARQLRTQELFAIKVIQKKWLASSEVIQAFVKEIEILSQVNHPHVVKIHGY
uniref:non-specific serine/threonine protein kinase n=1 Tax=Hippocampus comes TaxID=109280 RepID=A0A3Q2XUA9_HIPCM